MALVHGPVTSPSARTSRISGGVGTFTLGDGDSHRSDESRCNTYCATTRKTPLTGCRLLCSPSSIEVGVSRTCLTPS